MKKTAIATLLLGICIGSVGVMLYTTRDLDELRDKVAALEQTNQALANENDLLSAQLQNPESQRPLNAIKVECTTPTDLSVQAQLKQHVLKDLSFLQGKPIDILLQHPDLPTRILDQQLIHIGNRKFRVRVTLVIIAHDELTVTVTGKLDS